MNQEPRTPIRIAVDSNAFTYLVEATTPDYDPTADDETLAKERVAIVRIFLYLECKLVVLPAADAEWRKIEDERHQAHEWFLQILIPPEFWRPNKLNVDERTEELSRLHRGEKNRNDCRLLAQAEDCRIPVLLTRDIRFHRALVAHTKDVRLCYPSEYWESLGISKGARTITSPAPTNPLSTKTWWRW